MRKIFLTFLISLTLISCKGQNEKIDIDIIGEWKSEDKSGVGYVIFDDEGYANFNFEDFKLGGKEFVRNGKKFSLSYTLDYSTNPIHLDLTFRNIETNKEMKMLGIVKPVSVNEILYARGNGNSKRPTNFRGIETIRLNRIK